MSVGRLIPETQCYGEDFEGALTALQCLVFRRVKHAARTPEALRKLFQPRFITNS